MTGSLVFNFPDRSLERVAKAIEERNTKKTIENVYQLPID